LYSSFFVNTQIAGSSSRWLPMCYTTWTTRGKILCSCKNNFACTIDGKKTRVNFMPLLAIENSNPRFEYSQKTNYTLVYLVRKKEVNFILSYYTNLSHTGQKKFTSFFRMVYTQNSKKFKGILKLEHMHTRITWKLPNIQTLSNQAHLIDRFYILQPKKQSGIFLCIIMSFYTLKINIFLNFYCRLLLLYFMNNIIISFFNDNMLWRFIKILGMKMPLYLIWKLFLILFSTLHRWCC